MRVFIASATIVLALLASGCATKKYVVGQVTPVNDRVGQVQTQLSEQIAALNTKEQADVSRLDERITSTENRLATTTTTADQARTSAAQANATANQALQQAQADGTQISSVQAAVAKNQADIQAQAKGTDYNLSEVANVTFGVNKSDLTDDAKAALDLVVQKATSTPRSFLEVVGFTDTTGSKGYNMDLSQRRAESVARYFVGQNIPLKNIQMLGMGEEQTPEQLAAEVKDFDPAASAETVRGIARRVRVRLWVPASTASAAAGGAAAEVAQGR